MDDRDAVWSLPGATPERVRLHAILTRMRNEARALMAGESCEAEMWAHLERGILVIARMRQAEHLLDYAQADGDGEKR